jgi:hypothetical protein
MRKATIATAPKTRRLAPTTRAYSAVPVPMTRSLRESTSESAHIHIAVSTAENIQYDGALMRASCRMATSAFPVPNHSSCAAKTATATATKSVPASRRVYALRHPVRVRGLAACRPARSTDVRHEIASGTVATPSGSPPRGLPRPLPIRSSDVIACHPQRMSHRPEARDGPDAVGHRPTSIPGRAPGIRIRDATRRICRPPAPECCDQIAGS